MELKVIRKTRKATYTEGEMYVNGVFFCHTLEDRVRDLSKEEKIKGQTAVPKGSYEVILNVSPKFKRLLPRLMNVPYFSGVLIHRGNTAKDTAGCILVGKRSSEGVIVNSTATEDLLVKVLKGAKERGEKIRLTIEQ